MRGPDSAIRFLGMLAIGALLCGCIPDFHGDMANAPREAPRPAPAPIPVTPRPEQATPRSSISGAMIDYYARIASDLEGRGQMRTDVAPRDAPFDARRLTDDFIHIALYDEYTHGPHGFEARQTRSRLRRWEEPVRMEMEFGPSIPVTDRARDRTDVSAYAGKLAQATGHPVRVVTRGGNFHILFLNEDERRNITPKLRKMIPGIDNGSIKAITDLPLSTYCVVFAFSKDNSPIYSRAVAMIRGEHPDSLRRSCIQEELAQGLGLANDYFHARPSIFNDDEEFALLTHHDEMLLHMLYDLRLHPGMTEAQARPIVERIAREMMAGERRRSAR